MTHYFDLVGENFLLFEKVAIGKVPQVTVKGNSFEENRSHASNAKTHRLFGQLSWSKFFAFPLGQIY